jgi:TPR repeat protein
MHLRGSIPGNLMMMRAWLPAFLLSLATFGISVAQAQTASEPACVAGKAEACFYTAAEYAQGKGVPTSKQKAVQFFLMACDKGVPDGCYYSGNIHYFGEGDVPENQVQAIEYFERACRMGHVKSCTDANGILKNKPHFDIARLIPMLEAGCQKGASKACAQASELLYNGRNGQYPGHVDLVRAAPLVEKSCADDANIYKGLNAHCWYAEDVFANPSSKAFNATKAIQYTRLNCDNGRAGSCSNLGRVYDSIEEWPLALAAYESACRLDAKSAACASIAPIRKYLTELAAYEAKVAERKQTITGLLRDGSYGVAVNTALYQYGSVEYAEMAALAASKAGRMSDIGTQDLYALASWFREGPVRAAADSEMARRGTGLEGQFGTGTNQAGAADARWKAQNGSIPSRPSSSSGYMADRPTVLSSGNAAAQTREKYRYAHCTMSGNANRNLCR